MPNSGTGEANPPQRSATVVGNLVYDNNNAETPAIELAQFALGTGIIVYGGEDDQVLRNRVIDHDVAGIAVIPAVEKLLEPDDPNAENFDAVGNRVVDNVVEGSTYDLVLISTIDDAADAGDNCFSGNTYATSLPDDIQAVVPCTGSGTAFEAPLETFAGLVLGERPAGTDYRTVALPDRSDLPDMPNATTAKPRPATHEPSIRVKVKKLAMPPAPTG